MTELAWLFRVTYPGRVYCESDAFQSQIQTESAWVFRVTYPNRLYGESDAFQALT